MTARFLRRLLARSRDGLFASETLPGHLLRGAVAFALLAAALHHRDDRPAWAAAGALLALVAMRGCPMCWTIGLVETIAQRFRRRGRGSGSGSV